MSNSNSPKADKKEAIKRLIKRLHEGAGVEETKEKFKEEIKDISSSEIAAIEEELIKEGMPREEVQKLCDVHLAVFRESIEREKTAPPAGHPIHILMEEHNMLLKFAAELKNTSQAIKRAADFNSIGPEIEKLRHIEEHLKSSESHYVREENVIFPSLERHGITQPPAMMWMEHDRIREIKKNFYKLMEEVEKLDFKEFKENLEAAASLLSDMLSTHFYKENNILFPTALKVIGANEWQDIREQFDDLGYCCFTPEEAKKSAREAEAPTSKPEKEGLVAFESGTLSKDELEAIFNTLPVDITFVDKEDTVRYFSQSRERIFPRAKAVIGRKVQHCHPQKSIHIVNQILEDFKSGKRDEAHFWINLKGRLIHIRYFAVRNKNRDYLGCLEVTQDITDIKKIEGEKRLL